MRMKRRCIHAVAVMWLASGKPSGRVAMYSLAITSALLLSGCQSTDSSWSPRHWFWQHEELKTQPDPQLATRTKTVNDLIARGNLAYTKDRLTIPADDNAILYYRKALDLDPSREEAWAGIKQVCKRYRTLARIAHDNGDAKRAQQYLHQSEVILGFDHPANRKLRKELQDTPAGQRQRGLDQSVREKYNQQKERLNEYKANAPSAN